MLVEHKEIMLDIKWLQVGNSMMLYNITFITPLEVLLTPAISRRRDILEQFSWARQHLPGP